MMSNRNGWLFIINNHPFLKKITMNLDEELKLFKQKLGLTDFNDNERLKDTWLKLRPYFSFYGFTRSTKNTALSMLK